MYAWSVSEILTYLKIPANQPGLGHEDYKYMRFKGILKGGLHKLLWYKKGGELVSVLDILLLPDLSWIK